MHQAIRTTEEGQALRTFEGTTIVPLDAESANYREWLVTIGGTQYCVIQDQDESVPRPEGRSFSLASCQPGSREPDRRDPQA